MNIHILHGDDHLELKRAVQRFCASSDDSGMADLNTTRLDGQTAGEDEISNAAMSLPFLTSSRLVILTHPLARLAGESSRTRFKGLLDHLPSTTTLVLVIEDEWDHRSRDWHSLPGDHWLRQWIAGAGRKAELKTIKLPSQNEMPEWIRKQAEQAGGRFSPTAARALADHTGNNTQVTGLEITKLLTYVNFERLVEVDDVELLTTAENPVNIFEMVDALSAGDKSKAVRLLHRLLDDQDPFLVFGMIIRQFRLLLLTREILDEGGGKAQLTKEGIARGDLMANKLLAQAPRFSLPNLEKIYHRLLELDQAIKTSQMSHDLALDTLVAELSN